MHLPTIGIKLAILLLLILCNAALAMSELAVVSARAFRLKRWSDRGDKGARKALELARNPGPFLSTVQAGITLISILAGAFGGTMLSGGLAAWFKTFPLTAPYANSLALGIVVAAITYATIIFGELVPKRLGLARAERLASIMAYPVAILAKLALPVVWLLNTSTELVLRFLRIKPAKAPPLTDEELKILLEQGADAGAFESAETEMMSGVLRLGDRTAADLMTPRGSVDWLEVDASPKEIAAALDATGHSRFPVARHEPNNLLGIVQTRDLLARMLKGLPPGLKACVRQPLFVPESTPLLKTLAMLSKHPLRMGVVLDEYGAFQGVVTLNDILLSIAGSVTGDESDPPIIQREDGSWLIDGMLPIDEIEEVLGPGLLPAGKRGLFHTLAGFTLMHLGRIPKSGDHFTWRGFRFEVVDMDGLRVDKVLVSPTNPGNTPPSANRDSGSWRP